MVLLKRTVSERYQNGQTTNGDPDYEFIGWDITDLVFDTTIQQDVTEEYFVAGGEGVFTNFQLAEGAVVHEECGPLRSQQSQSIDAETTFWTWRYTRYFTGTLPPEGTINSTACGYVAPTCDLKLPTVSVNGTTATITATGNRGQLRYSRDAGLSLQSSNVFAGLVLGQRYTVRVIDQGVTDCFREISFLVRDQTDGGVEPGPDTPPTTDQPVAPQVVPTVVESLSYALGLVFETITTTAFRTVRLELWMETSHYNRNYRRVVELEKRADADGSVSFQLNRLLADRLQPEKLNLLANQASVVGEVVKNYFCRWRTVNTDNGTLGPWTNRPLRTALLSGLALPGGWLTTQQASKQVLATGQSEFLFFLTPPSPLPVVTVRRVLEVENLPPAVDDELVSLQGREEDVVSLQGTASRVLLIPVFNSPLPSGARRLTVSVLGSEGVVLGQSQQYDLVLEPEPDQKLFLFATPVGGIDTLLTRGASQTTLDVKASVTERGAYPGQALRTPLRTIFDLNETRVFRQVTGYLTPQQQKWLQTFMLSRWHWLATDEHQLEPVLIFNRKMTYDRTDPRTEGLTFEYEMTSAAAGWNQLK